MRATITSSRSTTSPRITASVVKRTLVLDNLIHGYFILGHPERLDYDYEHIYALVAYRAAKASGKVTSSPRRNAKAETAESATDRQSGRPRRRASKRADPRKPSDHSRPSPRTTPRATPPSRPRDSRACKPRETSQEEAERTIRQKADVARQAMPGGEEPDRRTARSTGLVGPGRREIEPEDLVPGRRGLLLSAPHAVRLSGDRGRRRRDRPGRDPCQLHGDRAAADTPIQTYWGDARQFVELHQDNKKYDLVFGDAFNDFSVPWHLTTREFNEKIKKMLTPNGVYMINIIDVYMSDAEAEKTGRAEKIEDKIKSPTRPSRRRSASKSWPRPFASAVSSAPGPRPPGSLSPRLHLRHRRRSGSGSRGDLRGRRFDAGARPRRPGKPRRRSQVLHRRRRTEPKPYGHAERRRSRSAPARSSSPTITLPSKTCSPRSPRRGEKTKIASRWRPPRTWSKLAPKSNRTWLLPRRRIRRLLDPLPGLLRSRRPRRARELGHEPAGRLRLVAARSRRPAGFLLQVQGQDGVSEHLGDVVRTVRGRDAVDRPAGPGSAPAGQEHRVRLRFDRRVVRRRCAGSSKARTGG